MTSSTPPHRTRRAPKWLPVLAVVATAAALIVLAALLLRRLGPQPAVWLHMTPAAATVEDAAAVVLSSGGWGSEEEVAICLNAPDDGACDAAVAILVERADDAGNLSVSLPAGPYLAEGRTAVVVRGLETDRQAGRTFRVLRAPETSVVSAGAATAPAASPTVDLTPIAGAQTPGDPASLVGGAWTAEYFANPDLSGAPAIVREEGELAFDWGAGAPDPALLPDGFSARWVRRLAFPGMTHRFVVQADGGARVFVDDVLLIDLWQDDGVLATASASIDLTPGEHTVRVEYFDQAGNAAIALRWEAIDLFPDWRGEYFTNPDLAGEPALVRNDPDPNLDWGENSPAPGVIPSDGFSVRWTRTLDFAPGLYRFILTADDGGRLLVEGQPVIDAWQDAAGETSTADRSLSGGQYQIVVQHRDLSGPARIAAGWSLLAASTPVQIAGVTPTAPSGVTPTPAPVVTPSATPTVTPGALPSSTPNPETTTPTATETPVPTSSSTASPGAATGTPNGTVTAGATGTPTTTPDTPTPTATATPQTTGTPQFPPGSVERFIEINPTIGEPGQEILVSSGNWAPGTVIRVSLGEFNTPYTMATPLPGVSFTTPTDSSQPWSFRFVFPNQPPWSTQTRPVQVWVHNAGWTEWGRDLFEFNLP